MKTAEEWMAEGEVAQHVLPEFIRAIQADALYHASEFVGNMPKQYDRMRAWDGPYRAACVFARSHLREQAADLLTGKPL